MVGAGVRKHLRVAQSEREHMVKTLILSALLLSSLIHRGRSLDPAVFTREAGLVPGSVGPGLDCWDLLPLLLGTDCAWPSVSEQSIEVTVCVLSPDSGALIITSSDRGAAARSSSPGQVGLAECHCRLQAVCLF